MFHINRVVDQDSKSLGLKKEKRGSKSLKRENGCNPDLKVSLNVWGIFVMLFGNISSWDLAMCTMDWPSPLLAAPRNHANGLKGCKLIAKKNNNFSKNLRDTIMSGLANWEACFRCKNHRLKSIL